MRSALPNADLVAGLLMIPSIIGEFWIIGYLIAVGVHDCSRHPTGLVGPSCSEAAS